MRLRSGPCLAVVALAALSTGREVWAQGFLIDRRPHVPVARSYEVREVTVDARVRDQVAEVQVSQTFHNPGSFVLESEYLFPLPEEGAIQNFVLMVDGKEMPGRLLPKDEARRIYEEIVRTKRDPALLEYMGRGMFRTSVFPIPPGADRKVTMRYTQLCKRERDVVEFAYPFATQKFTAKPIRRLALELHIRARDAIKSLYCPSHDARVVREGDHEARVTLEQRDVVPSTDFRLLYTMAEGTVGATVLSARPSEGDDGFFLLLASPDVKAADVPPRAKTVVFVLDRSGSMAGKKIEQARRALVNLLNNLRDDDMFNIVVYDDRVESYKPELQRYSSTTRAEAVRFVENIREGGSTNIDSALTTALGMIQDDSRPNYVLFFTDGLPTAGETKEMAISENSRKANSRRARIFAFGVGFDVNARLLDRLSGGNGGTSEYVKPDQDIEASVARFGGRLTSPVLSDIRIELANTDVNRTYPRDLPDLFEGGQMVWVGRYRQSGPTTIRLSGKVGGERRSFEFPAELAGPGRGSGYDFVEKLWAMRRVGSIIDQIDLQGANKELTDELVALSTKYGILTPYTSFLADERVSLHARRENAATTYRSLSALDNVTGQAGVAQRSNKQKFLNADRAPAPASPSAMRGMAGMGAGMGGMFGGMSSAGGAMPSGPRRSAGEQFRSSPRPGIVVQDVEGKESVVTSVRQVGAKTFYRKADRWVDSSVQPDQDAKATVIRQFSDEFFALANGQKNEMNQYLTFEEPVTVNLDGRVYRIEPAPR